MAEWAFFPRARRYHPDVQLNPKIPMLNALTSLSPLAILVVSVIGFALGAVWYSPMLFVKAWMAEVKMTPESAKAAGVGKSLMIWAFLCTIVSTLALAVLVAGHHTRLPLKGAELGLFVGVGLVAARQAVNGLFELRSLKVFMIVSGFEVVQFTVLGAILAVWR
jgi:hypothetical protein